MEDQCCLGELQQMLPVHGFCTGVGSLEPTDLATYHPSTAAAGAFGSLRDDGSATKGECMWILKGQRHLEGFTPTGMDMPNCSDLLQALLLQGKSIPACSVCRYSYSNHPHELGYKPYNIL